MKVLTTKALFNLAKETVKGWIDDQALQLSAALAYYSIFSIAPILIIAISIAGLVFGEAAVRGHLDEELKNYIGAQAAEGVQSMVQSASKPAHGWMGAITGFVTLMLGASGVFGQLKQALNTIWEVKTKSSSGVFGYIRQRLLSFSMVLVIGFLLVTSLLLTTALASLSGYVSQLIRVPVVLWGAIAFVLSMGVVVVLFALIFKVLPDAGIAWRDVWVGALFTALLFEVGKFALGLYLVRESTASSYGAAGAVVLLLLWVYYTSCILLLGAEFTEVYSRTRGHVVVPDENAEPTVVPDSVDRETSSEASDAGRPSATRLIPRWDESPSREPTAPAYLSNGPSGGLQSVRAVIVVTFLSCLAGLLGHHYTSRR